MLTRRKILLNLLKISEVSTSLRIQKLMFLICIELKKSKIQEPYIFYPSKMGPYSLTLSNDYHILNEKGYILKEDSKYSIPISLDENIEIDSYSLDIIKRIVSEHKALDDLSLTRITYINKPFYSINSEIVDKLNLGHDYYQNLETIKEKIKQFPKGIYTIGYEGKTIDELIRILKYRNIQIVIDVRKNAISMKKDFSKKNLKKYLEDSGIEYIHHPEVGIDTALRKELLLSGKRSQLFEWYKMEILPNLGSFIKDIEPIIKEKSIVLLCYEKNPEDCHRSYLAEHIKKNSIYTLGVYNI